MANSWPARPHQRSQNALSFGPTSTRGWRSWESSCTVHSRLPPLFLSLLSLARFQLLNIKHCCVISPYISPSHPPPVPVPTPIFLGSHPPPFLPHYTLAEHSTENVECECVVTYGRLYNELLTLLSIFLPGEGWGRSAIFTCKQSFCMQLLLQIIFCVSPSSCKHFYLLVYNLFQCLQPCKQFILQFSNRPPPLSFKK